MDSELDTRRHSTRVLDLMINASRMLLAAGQQHDRSKLMSDEKPIFDEFSPKLAASTYGSEEYKGFLAAMKPALDHHYAANRHHAEHFCWKCAVCGGAFSAAQAPEVDWGDQKHRFCPRCMPYPHSSVLWEMELVHKPGGLIEGMTLMDLIEMLCDWKAASERHATGDLAKSIDISVKRFNIGPQLESILRETVRMLFPPLSDLPY